MVKKQNEQLLLMFWAENNRLLIQRKNTLIPWVIAAVIQSHHFEQYECHSEIINIKASRHMFESKTKAE